MPNMDGTGPRAMGRGNGLGRRQCRGGFRRGMRRGPCSWMANEEKTMLMAKKELLTGQLADVERQLSES